MIKSLVLELATFLNGLFLFSKHSEYTSLIKFTKKVVIHHPMSQTRFLLQVSLIQFDS